MQRYFLAESYEEKKSYVLEKEQYHHVVRVMRMEVKERVFLVFSNQLVIVAQIIEITKEQVILVEISKELQEKELPIDVTIACGYPKGDKLEWIVQKGTELGAMKFIGFPAKQSVVKWEQKKLLKKQERLNKIATEAAEQSQRQKIPEVELLAQTAELLSCFSNFTHVLVAYEESAKQGEHSTLMTTLNQMTHGESLLILFGPEGGFSHSEIQLFENAAAKVCGLGPRILRAETAPLYVLSAISYQFELV